MKKMIIAALVLLGFGGVTMAQTTMAKSSATRVAPKMTIAKKTSSTPATVTPGPKPAMTAAKTTNTIGKKHKKAKLVKKEAKATKKQNKVAGKRAKTVTKPMN